MTAAGRDVAGAERHARRRRYRRVVVGAVFGGVGGGLLLRWGLGYPLVGEAVYWLGIVLALVVWLATPVALFDERDAALERRASQVTLSVFAVVLVLGASAARVLTYAELYEVPEPVWAALWGYVALFATFGVVYLALRYRS